MSYFKCYIVLIKIFSFIKSLNIQILFGRNIIQNVSIDLAKLTFFLLIFHVKNHAIFIMKLFLMTLKWLTTFARHT